MEPENFPTIYGAKIIDRNMTPEIITFYFFEMSTFHSRLLWKKRKSNILSFKRKRKANYNLVKAEEKGPLP